MDYILFVYWNDHLQSPPTLHQFFHTHTKQIQLWKSLLGAPQGHAQAQKFSSFLHHLVQKSPVNTQFFCSYPFTLDVFKNCHTVNHLSCFHSIFLQDPNPMTYTVREVFNDAGPFDYLNRTSQLDNIQVWISKHSMSFDQAFILHCMVPRLILCIIWTTSFSAE